MPEEEKLKAEFKSEDEDEEITPGNQKEARQSHRYLDKQIIHMPK